VDIPLVLHGASGLSDNAVRECITEGICKVNFATELRMAYTEGVRSFLNEDAKAFDPKKYGAVGMERVKQLVLAKIRVCGSANHA
jgi:tagatose 1,6-diphosphate aldolase GatY/KbaY